MSVLLPNALYQAIRARLYDDGFRPKVPVSVQSEPDDSEESPPEVSESGQESVGEGDGSDDAGEPEI